MTPRMMNELLDAAAEAARRGESFDSFASRMLDDPPPGGRRRPRRRKKRR